MKKITIILALMSLLAFKKLDKTRIVFFGDSITQMGMNKDGYIDKIKTALEKSGKTNQYHMIGAGVSGNKIYDLYLRIEEDVLDKKPNTVIIYEGVNDVWHKTSGTGTDLDKYEKFYVAVIKKLQAQHINLLLITPACIGEKKNNENAQDLDLNKYCDVIRKLATTYNCQLLDLRKMTQDYEHINNTEDKEEGLLTVDKVHLTDTGNQLLADALMKDLGM